MIGSLGSTVKLRRVGTALSSALALALVLLFTAGLFRDTRSVAAQVPPTALPGKATPAGTIVPVCRDSYEDDGVPSQAKPLVIDETQMHAFCPADDADWVTFFAKGGKGYGIETSGLAAGVDTYLNLFASDGRTLLSTNDDAEGAHGSSRLLFYPQADGRYFVQAKNQGDIGYPGLQYSLSFEQVDMPTATPVPTEQATPTLPPSRPSPGPAQPTQTPFKADLLHPQKGDGGVDVFEAGPQDALQPDGLEPDDSRETAWPINVGGVYKYLNFVPGDPQPSNGSTRVDADFFTFRAKPGLCYLVQTGDLSSGLDTTILLWQKAPAKDAKHAKDGWKLVGQNDDAHPRTPDLGSAVRWCTPADSMGVIEVRNYGGQVATDPRGKSYSLSLVIDPPPSPTPPSPVSAPAQPAAPSAPQLPRGGAVQAQQVPVAPVVPVVPVAPHAPTSTPVLTATSTPSPSYPAVPSATPTVLPPTPAPTSTPAPGVSVDVVAYVGDPSSTGPNPGDGIVDLPVLLVDVRTNATIQQTTTDRNGHAQLSWQWQGPVRVALPAFRWGRTLQLADFTSSGGTGATGGVPGGGVLRGGQLLLLAKMSSYLLPGIYP